MKRKFLNQAEKRTLSTKSAIGRPSAFRLYVRPRSPSQASLRFVDVSAHRDQRPESMSSMRISNNSAPTDSKRFANLISSSIVTFASTNSDCSRMISPSRVYVLRTRTDQPASARRVILSSSVCFCITYRVAYCNRSQCRRRFPELMKSPVDYYTFPGGRIVALARSNRKTSRLGCDRNCW